MPKSFQWSFCLGDYHTFPLSPPPLKKKICTQRVSSSYILKMAAMAAPSASAVGLGDRHPLSLPLFLLAPLWHRVCTDICCKISGLLRVCRGQASSERISKLQSMRGFNERVQTSIGREEGSPWSVGSHSNNGRSRYCKLLEKINL